MDIRTSHGSGTLLGFGEQLSGRKELPIGSELMIAVALGGAGWWLIVRTILWLAA